MKMTPPSPWLQSTPVIILAAGRTPAWLTSFLEPTCPAMIPVNGRPVIHWSLRYLHACGATRVLIGTRPEETRFQRFVHQGFARSLEVEMVPVGVDRGPGYTLLQCLRRLPAGGSCLVVLGDTIFEFPQDIPDPADRSFVLVAEADEASRWCLAQVQPDGRVRAFADKPEANPGNWPALIGVYYLQNLDAARAALEGEDDRGNASLQLRHALAPYLDGPGGLLARKASEWLDCGNMDLLSSSRRRLLQARNFNSLSIDEVRGTITKRSTHVEKFTNEINYYRLLPPDLAIFFPRLMAFDLNPEAASLTLEYYGYPPLSEKWVFDEMELTWWRRIFQSLNCVMDCFAAHPARLAPATLETFYREKTLARIAHFAAQDPAFRRLTEAGTIRVSGRRYAGWPRLLPAIEKRLPDVIAHARGQVIHGDLCLPNILFDPLSRLIKLIDPRGSFGDCGINGDAQYDAAKLLHSLDGGYDFIIHDMFELKEDGGDYDLALFLPENAAAVLQTFREVSGDRFHFDSARLLEGLIFLSICPLHAPEVQRQKAMWLTGIRICNEVLGL